MRMLILMCIIGMSTYQKLNAMDTSVFLAINDMEAKNDDIKRQKAKPRHSLETKEEERKRIEHDRQWIEQVQRSSTYFKSE